MGEDGGNFIDNCFKQFTSKIIHSTAITGFKFICDFSDLLWLSGI